MNKITSASCLVAALTLHASALQAQVHLVDVPPGKDTIVPVHKGEPAPFEGQLFSNDTSLRWANWLIQLKMGGQLDAEMHAKLSASNLELFQQKLALEEKQYTNMLAEMNRKLAAAEERADNPPWYRAPWFCFTAGVVGTLATVLGTASLVQAAK